MSSADSQDYINALSLDEQRRLANELVRCDFQFFAHRALTSLHGQIDWSWHHKAMAEFAFEIAEGDKRHTMINLPPRSLKSDIFSAILPAWVLGRNPKAKIICLSHSQDLGEKLATKTRRIMQTPWYAEAFPQTRLSSRALANMRTGEGGFRVTSSIDGGLTGQGGDFIIVDDPMKADDAESDVVRASVNEWMSSTLFSRLDNQTSGSIVVVAQRLHQDDPCGRLLDGDDWEVLSIPAIANEETRYFIGRGEYHTTKVGELMHAERLGADELAKLRRRLGERKFEAQYQQSPVPADGSFFKREWLKFDDDVRVRRPGDRVVQSWDVAAKTGEGNDFSVCITAVVRRSQVLIIDVLRQRLTFPELMKAVLAQATTYKPRQILIEEASAGLQLIQMIEATQPRGLPLPIKIKPILSKSDRASTASVRCERGELLLPQTAGWLDGFVNEMMAFPGGRHDDQVDALAHLMTYTQSDYPRGVSPGVETRVSPFVGFGQDAEFGHLGDPDLSSDFHFTDLAGLRLG